MLLNDRRVQYRFLLEDAFEKVGLAQGRTDVQTIPADDPDVHTPPPDIASQSPHKIGMSFVESIRQAKQGGQLPNVAPPVGVQVFEVLVVILWKRSAMIASDQADDHAFLGSKGELGRTNDDLLRQFVMFFRVLSFAHIVEYRSGTEPNPLGIAHAVQRLKLVEKTQGKSRNLKRVTRFEAVRFANSDDGVDDPSASQDASLKLSVLCHQLVPIVGYIGRTSKGA
jgi:hypothetical protein